MSVEATTVTSAVELEHAVWRRRLLLDPRPRDEMNRMILKPMMSTGWRYWAVVAILALLVFIGLVVAWGYQIVVGMGVAGIRRPVFWGVYIANFVFWIGISHAGTMVSAILRALHAEWRRPVTRVAEAMTVFALIVAGMYPLIHLGRVWRFYWMLPYPNQRQLWPNFHSPLEWDMMAIFTYLIGSILLLYMPLIPDLAMARDHTTGWRHWVYRFLALGWRGTEAEWHHLRTAMNIFTYVIIPVAVSVHTIVSWDFAMTLVPGWQSTIFGPYFVIGAIYSGIAALITVLLIVRKSMGLDYFLREEHFDALGKLLLVVSFFWTYFWFNGFLTEWYGGEPPLRAIHELLLGSGAMAPFFDLMLLGNVVLPWATLWWRRVRTSPKWLLIVALMVNVGMYLERYLIVVATLSRNRLPFAWGVYRPSLVELLISLGSLALFLFLYTLLSRLVPLISVWEVQEGQVLHTLRRVGRIMVPTVSELE